MNCFVIMPFSKSSDVHTNEYWDAHFDDFLKPLIEEIEGAVAFRSQALRGDILRQIITDLLNCPIVVADLTDLNANVFWELGVRQSFKHGTITIAEKGTRLPFDIDKKGTLFYSNSHSGNKKFKEQFKSAIDDCINNPQRPDSTVLEALSGRGTLYEIINREENIRRLEALVSELTNNKRIYSNIVFRLKENKNVKTLEKKTVTERFRISSAEWLLTIRYLPNEIVNYKDFENYCTWMIAYNYHMDCWSSQFETSEDWMNKEECMNTMNSIFDKLILIIELAIKKIQG